MSMSTALWNLQKKRCRQRKHKLSKLFYWQNIHIAFSDHFFCIFLLSNKRTQLFSIKFIVCQCRIWFLLCPHQVTEWSGARPAGAAMMGLILKQGSFTLSSINNTDDWVWQAWQYHHPTISYTQLQPSTTAYTALFNTCSTYTLLVNISSKYCFNLHLYLKWSHEDHFHHSVSSSDNNNSSKFFFEIHLNSIQWKYKRNLVNKKKRKSFSFVIFYSRNLSQLLTAGLFKSFCHQCTAQHRTGFFWRQEQHSRSTTIKIKQVSSLKQQVLQSAWHNHHTLLPVSKSNHWWW